MAHAVTPVSVFQDDLLSAPHHEIAPMIIGAEGDDRDAMTIVRFDRGETIEAVGDLVGVEAQGIEAPGIDLVRDRAIPA